MAGPTAVRSTRFGAEECAEAVNCASSQTLWWKGDETMSAGVVAYPSTVAQSAVGLCLVATADLEPASVVEKFAGPVVTYAAVPEEEVRYALLIGDDDWLVPRTNARYLNHACNPNCYITDALDVVTLRRVVKGEELTIFYNGLTMAEYWGARDREYFWDTRWSFQCQCGSERCLGLIDRYVVPPVLDPNSAKLYIGVVPRRGRGVFACKAIATGELIERAPVIVIPASQCPNLEHTALYDYTFAWGEEDEDAAVALGYGSIYNHSYSPNARYVKRIEEMVIDFVALRDIQPGAEIVVNYNGEPGNREPLWFEVDADS